jgi:hypothetical protein
MQQRGQRKRDTRKDIHKKIDIYIKYPICSENKGLRAIGESLDEKHEMH